MVYQNCKMLMKICPTAHNEGDFTNCNATMQNRFRELDIFSFLLSEGLIPITDSGTSDHFR